MNDRARENGTTADPTRQAAQRLLAQIADGAWLTVEEAADVRLVAEAVMEVVRLREALDGLVASFRNPDPCNDEKMVTDGYAVWAARAALKEDA